MFNPFENIWIPITIGIIGIALISIGLWELAQYIGEHISWN